ncbi:MAG: hypothetical protein AABP62_15835 [Planctomycetota bacterium]
MGQAPEGDWRQKRWPIPPEALKLIQLRLWGSVKKPLTSATRRKAALKLLRDINNLRRGP